MPVLFTIAPRWLIFLIDTGLCLVAVVMAKTLKKNFILEDINLLALYKSMALAFVVNTLVFTACKTYSGIIRFTSGQDTFRILLAVLSSLSMMFLYNLVATIAGSPVFISA